MSVFNLFAFIVELGSYFILKGYCCYKTTSKNTFKDSYRLHEYKMNTSIRFFGNTDIFRCYFLMLPTRVFTHLFMWFQVTVRWQIWSKILILHYTHTICSNNKRIHGGIAPALQDKEDDWGWSLRTCHVKLLDQWRRRSAQSQNSIGEWSQSAGETRWKPGLLISTDWNVSLSPAPSGNRSRILSLLFLIAKEHFLGRGFGQWTRWTRSRIHAGGTNRTPYSSFAGLTRWVSFSVGSFFAC